MPLKRYEVLKGSVVVARREDDSDSPHYQVRVHANTASYRVAFRMSGHGLLFS